MSKNTLNQNDAFQKARNHLHDQVITILKFFAPKEELPPHIKDIFLKFGSFENSTDKTKDGLAKVLLKDLQRKIKPEGLGKDADAYILLLEELKESISVLDYELAYSNQNRN